MKKLTSKQQAKKIDSDIEAAFKVHFDRVVIPIMDIPKIYSKARAFISQGLDADTALKNIRQEYL